MTDYRARRMNTAPFALAALLAFALILAGCGGNRSSVLSPANVAGPAQPTCPTDAHGPPFAGSATRPMPAEGCWNATNLASMVADPRDLIRGKALGPAVGARESVNVETYRKGPVTGSSGPAAGGAIISVGGTTTGSGSP